MHNPCKAVGFADVGLPFTPRVLVRFGVRWRSLAFLIILLFFFTFIVVVIFFFFFLIISVLLFFFLILVKFFFLLVAFVYVFVLFLNFG